MINRKKKFIPVAYCPTCKRKEILNITNMKHKSEKTKISIAACGFCDTVLNLDGNVKIDYVSKLEAEKLGWTLKKKSINS